MTRGHLLPLAVLSLGLIAATTGDDAHEHHAEDDVHDVHDDHDDHDDLGLVRLSPEEIREFGIQLRRATRGVIEMMLEMPGEVRPDADRLAHIVPRYSGIVTEVRAHIGDRVQKGQVLAIIESNESLAPFEVRTLLSGTVIGKHIALGEAAARDRDAFVIADLSNVWIDVTVYQRDLDRVRVGQTVRVLVGHEPIDEGAIVYLTPVVDDRTRTATARVVLPNDEGFWRPGMFVTAHVVVEKTEVPVAIPLTALQTLGGHPVVFVETDEGFAPEPVTLGRSGDVNVEVLAGLDAGERYVSAGGFTLKAELEKGAVGHGHAH